MGHVNEAKEYADQANAVMEGIVKQYLETAVPETKTDVKDTENTTDDTEDATTEKSSKKA